MTYRLFPFSLLLLVCTSIYSQNFSISGRVIDASTKEPLAFVNIIYNERNHGTTTGINGEFTLKTEAPPEFLKFSFIGYETQVKKISADDNGKMLLIRLKEKTIDIAEVTVFPGENPAHRIIRKVTENRDLNNPEKMTSFSYTSYNKMVFTTDIDTIDPAGTTVTLADDSCAEQRKDTSIIKLKKFLDKQYFLLIESVSERQYLYPDRNKETVIASRVSGLQNMTFALLATQMQSFSFYRELITILDKMYLNPVSSGSTRKYFFLLEDTTFTEIGDTVFIISYRPKKGANFDGLKGVLYINTNRYAIQNVIAEPAEISTAIGIKIQQKYEFVDNQQWFPVQLNTDITFNNLIIDTRSRKLPITGIGKSYLKNIMINPPVDKNQFGHIEVKMNDDAAKKTEPYWNSFRFEPLSPKDTMTYHVIDSISKAEKIEQKITIFEALMTGYIPFYFLNIDYLKVISYNQYEGFRTGIGLITNRKFSEDFSVGGYAGYGFRDRKFKYGFECSAVLDEDIEAKIKIAFSKDVAERGHLSFFEDRPSYFSTENYRKILIDSMDRIVRLDVSFSRRMFEYLRLNISGSVQQYQISQHPYLFKNSIVYLDMFHKFYELGFNMRYAFREKFMQTPRAEFSMGTNYPVVFVNITYGIDENSMISYLKYEVKVVKSLVSKTFGRTFIQFTGGMANNILPLQKLYNGYGSYLKSYPFWADCSFNTMRMDEFYADRFISLFLRQDFGSLLFKTKNFAPKIGLVTNIGFGKLKKEYFTEDYNFLYNGYLSALKSYEKGYFESGILFNNIIKMNMFGYGFGVFYRYGHYAFARTADNFAYKFSLTIDF